MPDDPQPPYPGASGESPSYPGPPPGHPPSIEVVASPPSASWTVVGSVAVAGLVAGTAAVGEAAVALRAWNDCDPHIDASASVLTMMVLGLPLLLIVNALVVLVATGLTWRLTRSVSWRALWMGVVPTLAVVVLAYMWWVVWVTPAGDPDLVCPGGVPPWAPRWLPS